VGSNVRRSTNILTGSWFYSTPVRDSGVGSRFHSAHYSCVFQTLDTK
jgi:hypothetical protein